MCSPIGLLRQEAGAGAAKGFLLERASLTVNPRWEHRAWFLGDDAEHRSCAGTSDPQSANHLLSSPPLIPRASL